MRNIRNILVLIAAFLALLPGAGIAASLRVTWNANTDSDTAGYKVYYGTQSNVYGTPVPITGATSYDIPNVQAGSTYYVAVSAYDSSNNESTKSSVQSASIPGSTDTTPPTGSVSINSGSASTASTAVTLTLSASDAAGTVTGMKFSNDGTTFSSEVAYATSYSWTLSSGSGTKTVYVRFKDNSGNWMTSSATDTIQLAAASDTTPPTGSVSINSGAASTTSTSVTLTLSASDAAGTVTGMKFSNDGTTFSSEVAYATSYSWTLSSGVGTKTVYVRFKDNSGNWMTSSATDTIQLVAASDTTPPTGSISINSGAATTTTAAVTVTLSASDAAGTVTGMKFSLDGTTYTSEIAYATSYSGSLPSGYGTKTVYVLFKDNSGNWMTSPATDTINYVSGIPVANAGTNQNVAPQRVILDGSASSGQGLSYSWTQVSGTTVIIETPTASTASFMGIKAGTYQFRLTCTNSAGSNSATVNVTIQNVTPTVNAGSNMTIATGTQITLHATGQDPNEDNLTYQWTKVSSQSVTLPNMSQQDITFTPTIAGQYTFSVRCSDGVNTSTASQVIVTVNAVNHAPTANAGQNQELKLGSTVTLNGTASTDPDNNSLTYAWVKASGPQVTLTGASTAQPSFVAATLGTYVFNLTVNDGTVNSTPSSVTITIVAQNTSPVANAGQDMHAYVGDDVVLNASGSYDSDNDGISFTWTQVSGASMVIHNNTMMQAFFTPTTSGVFEFRVAVSDGQATSTDNVIVTVDNANQVPIANAGGNIVAAVGQTVTLNGSASYDPDGTAVSYIWSQTSGTQVSLGSPNTARPSFVAGQAGVYVFALRVYDGTDTSSSSAVTVTVQDNTNDVTLVSPAIGTVCSTSPTLSWAGNGFKSYIAYISINGGVRYNKVYSGTKLSTILHSVLWQWFIPKGTTVTWYVQGTTTSGQIINSKTSTFIKK